MKIKDFANFLNESIVEDWKKNFLEKLVKKLEEEKMTATLDLKDHIITITDEYVIEDDKGYAVLDVRRPTIYQNFTTKLKFIFDDQVVKKYASPGMKFGLTDVDFSKLFTCEVASKNEVTIEEFPDFHHVQGDDNKFTDVDIDVDSEEDFIEYFREDINNWTGEISFRFNELRKLLDEYEKEHEEDEEDED